MAIGACQFMACRSMLGSPFRAAFHALDGGAKFLEVLLCSSHERECSELRDNFPNRLMVSPEGHVYSGLWLDSLGFLVG